MIKKLGITICSISIFSAILGVDNCVMAENIKEENIESFTDKCLVSPKLSFIGIANNPFLENQLVFPYVVSDGETVKVEDLAKEYQTTTLAIELLNDLEPGTEVLDSGKVYLIPMSPFITEEIQQEKDNYMKATQKEIISRSSSTNNAGKESSGFKTTISGSAVNTKTMVATAYGNDHGWGNKTALGTKCRPGVIAVDKRVIPLGTKVWISGYSSPHLPKGGFMAVAEDTGGKIKGNRIDIYLPHSERSKAVNGFGKQKVNIKIIG